MWFSLSLTSYILKILPLKYILNLIPSRHLHGYHLDQCVYHLSPGWVQLMLMEINKDQLNDNRQKYLFRACYITREPAPSLVFWLGEEWGSKPSSWGEGRLQVCADRKLSGMWQVSYLEAGHLTWLVKGAHLALSGWSYFGNVMKLSVINLVLPVRDWLLQDLLFGFMDFSFFFP